jgi:hypothetical protein
MPQQIDIIMPDLFAKSIPSQNRAEGGGNAVDHPVAAKPLMPLPGTAPPCNLWNPFEAGKAKPESRCTVS